MSTLLLDQAIWDLTLDASGDIAVAQDPYATAQDVATAIRLFLGEYWYDATLGVPYLSEILGENPSVQYMKAQWVLAAQTVPNVVANSIVAYITSMANGVVTGQVQFSLASDGSAQVAPVGPITYYDPFAGMLDLAQATQSGFNNVMAVL